MSLNKVMLIGSVGKDPEVKDANGAKVATFTLATNERYKDKNGEYKDNTEWHTIVAWRNTAEVVERFVRKGTPLYVEGKIRTRSWEDSNGNKRYVTEIIAESVQMLGKKDGGAPSNAEPVAQRPQYHTTPIVAGEPMDDDLPF